MSTPETASLGSGAMFDAIAPRYDLLNKLMSLGLDRRWRRALMETMPAQGALLDLATGTADVALALARSRPDCTVTGLDPSAGMLAVGAEKVSAAALGHRLSLIEGDAQALPFAEDAFSGCTMAFGIRNVPDRDAALREMRRVTAPEGVVSILEISEPRGGLMAGATRLWVQQVIPRLGAWLSGAQEYRYLQRSMARFPTPEAFAAQMQAAGFTHVEVRRFGFGSAHLYVARA